MKSFVFTVFFLTLSLVGKSQLACPTEYSGGLSNDDFPGCTTCSGLFSGTTFGYTKDDITYDFPCGEIDNSQWFNFVSDDSGIIEITVDFVSGDKGIELALYDEELNLLSNCVLIKTSGLNPSYYFDKAEKWQPYYLLIDGIDGAICDFSGKINGVSNVRPSYIEFIYQSPIGYVCVADELTFRFDPVQYGNKYRWNLSSNFEVIDGGGALDTFVKVTSKEPEIGTLTVTPFNECGDGFTATRYYEIDARKFVSIGDYNYCIEDENNLPPDSCVVVEDGCDSCFNYTFHLIEPSPITDVTEFICSEDCFIIGDSCFYGEGEHFAHFDNYYADGCDSIVRLILETQTVFPSPNIWYNNQIDGILVDWVDAPFAESYVTYVDRDSFLESMYSEVFIENPPPVHELYVKVQPKGNCTYLPAEITIINTFTGIDNLLLENAIRISPNPTTGFVNLETDLLIEEIEIYDSAGRFLQKEKSTSFDLSSRVAGIYFLKVKTNEGVGVKRILIK